MIDQDLLSVLACPVCVDRPALREQGAYLICTKVGHGFPIIEDIPHVLPEDAIEAEKLKELLSDQS